MHAAQQSSCRPAHALHASLIMSTVPYGGCQACARPHWHACAVLCVIAGSPRGDLSLQGWAQQQPGARSSRTGAKGEGAKHWVLRRPATLLVSFSSWCPSSQTDCKACMFMWHTPPDKNTVCMLKGHVWMCPAVLRCADASKQTEVGSLGAWAGVRAGTPGSITHGRSAGPRQSTGTMPSLAAAVAAGGMDGEPHRMGQI